MVASSDIISEYDDVLRREQFGFDEEDVDFIIKWFWNNSLIVEVNEMDYRPDEVIDEKDIPFYITAKATKSRLVTGNIKHYPIEEMRTMIWELT